MKTKTFVLIPNYWAFAPTLDRAFKFLRGESGRTPADIRRGKYYALEFPADTRIDVCPVDGGWQADKKPVRLVAHHGLQPDHIKRLEDMIER